MSSIMRTPTGWRVQWVDAEGKRKTHTLRTKDRRAAERFGARMDQEAAEIRAGLVDTEAVAIAEAAGQPWNEALHEWKEYQRRLNRSEKHIDQTSHQITRVANLVGWQALSDLNSDSFQHALDEIRRRGGKAKKGKAQPASARTVQSYVRALKGFARWCVRHDKLQSDPLAIVSAPNPRTDRKHVRRAMTRDEWSELRKYLAAMSTPRRGISPGHREIFYELLILTGYRKEEFRKLTVSSLQEAAGRCHLVLEPQHTKNGKPAFQMLPREPAERLSAILKGRGPNEPLVPMPEKFGVVRMLRADLSAARDRWIANAAENEQAAREASDFLAYEDHQGRKLDVHALRHTCGAWLAAAGVQPKVIQQVMRHASITTTFDLYGHLMPGMMENAIDQLGESAK